MKSINSSVSSKLQGGTLCSSLLFAFGSTGEAVEPSVNQGNIWIPGNMSMTWQNSAYTGVLPIDYTNMLPRVTYAIRQLSISFVRMKRWVSVQSLTFMSYVYRERLLRSTTCTSEAAANTSVFSKLQGGMLCSSFLRSLFWTQSPIKICHPTNSACWKCSHLSLSPFLALQREPWKELALCRRLSPLVLLLSW